MELTTHTSNLPIKLEDLAKFVLIGREKLIAVRAGIRALDKLDMAEGVRRQKKEEAQMLAEALLDAEVRIGEILSSLPKAQGARTELSNTTVTKLNTKESAVKELGFDKMQVSRFQTLAENKDIVEQIKQEARETDDLPTRTAVLQAAKARNRIVDIENKGSTPNIPDEDIKLIERMKNGETIVLNMDRNFHALKYAKDNDLFVQIDRWTDWGNPYFLGQDGDRDKVIESYEIYFSRKFGLKKKVITLKGKALGCHCYPDKCHGDHLKNMADGK